MRRRELCGGFGEEVAGVSVDGLWIEPGHQCAQVRQLCRCAADSEGVVRVAVRTEKPGAILDQRAAQGDVGLNNLEPVACASWGIVTVPAFALIHDARGAL